VTALLKVGWPDLGELPGFFGDDYLTSGADDIAEALRRYAESGVAHVLCQYHPNVPAALERLNEAVQIYRRSAAQRTARRRRGLRGCDLWTRLFQGSSVPTLGMLADVR
jgi:hypothetical protein